jgi:predicted CopG family antitoxin
MKSTQTIFNRDTQTVTISEREYYKLLQYKQLCQEFREVLGGDAE